MGLLDALFPTDDASGLLGFLKRNAELQPMPSGLPSDQADYGSPAQAPAQIAPPMNAMAQAPQIAPPVPANPPPVIRAPQPMAAPVAPAVPPAITPTATGASGAPGFMTGYENLHNGGGIIGSIVAGMTGQRNDPLGQAQQQQAQVANVTARALMQKGVPQDVAIAAVQPGNTEMLKTLITQTMGPQTLTSLGQGYVADKNGKVTRAYTPDDKIPSGFAQDDNGNMHFVPGGPADPAYQRLLAAQKNDPNAVHVLGKGGELYKVDDKGNATVVHKNDDGGQASLDDATVAMMAKQYLAGDRTVMQNLGRGAQGSANIVKLRAAIKAEADAQGLNGNDVAQRMIDYVGDTARERTAGNQEGRMSPAGIEAAGAIKLARQASLAVPRGNFVPINQAIQAWEKNTGDPAIRAFGSANTTLINTYARAINPNGVGTVADKEHAREMLSTADSPAAYEAVLDQLEREVQMAHASPAQAREQFKADRDRRLNGQPASVPSLPAASPTAPAQPQEGDIAHNPQTGETIIRKNGKWVPFS